MVCSTSLQISITQNKAVALENRLVKQRYACAVSIKLIIILNSNCFKRQPNKKLDNSEDQYKSEILTSSCQTIVYLKAIKIS